METTKKLYERIHVLEDIQTGIRNEGSSNRQEVMGGNSPSRVANGGRLRADAGAQSQEGDGGSVDEARE